MKPNVPLDEQETTINVFPKQISDSAEVYTCIPSMVSRLKKLKKENPKDVLIHECPPGIIAKVPQSWVKIAPKRKKIMTDEDKQIMLERFANGKEAKKK